MDLWLRLSRSIDRVNTRIGRWTSWLCLVMVLVTAYNTVVRYLGRFIGLRLSSNLYLELQWYLFSLLFLLVAAAALKDNAHVRVDILYSRLSRKGKAWIDVAGTVVLLLPFCLVTLWLSWPAVRNSWAVREISPDPGGLPRYPIKTFILVCFVLLILQAVSQLAKGVHVLRGGDEADVVAAGESLLHEEDGAHHEAPGGGI